MFAYRILEETETEPVLLERVKKHVRVLHNFEDDYLTGLIPVARIYCELFTNRAFIEKRVIFKTDFQEVLKLPLPPFKSVVSVSLITGRKKEVLQAESYFIEPLAEPAEMELEAGKPGDKIEVEYITGAIPSPPVKHAILICIADLFTNRETVKDGRHYTLPLSAKALLNQVKIKGGEVCG